MSTFENSIGPIITEFSLDRETKAGLDEVGHPCPDGPDGVGADGEEQNLLLPDWGPTDGFHGTDAETAAGSER
ncbi:hypothetical protein [Rathayibacter toxicus]|uniref:Uncharacterized protein n=1 Tax=Rathayibacter toxicus TaxID=145458 RepID=A0A0C5BD43_9MICO|nr:hypothetical protein [Rathayibacter toxicus]AJM77116.1 hypothetical protein TI83_02350 [Rathayibacter toxicus]ALS57051.1 hypothetical protein APU90_04125 [Rathayibacter toxicus]KKM46124.1 hypothetical protein VT73_03365 [Rathayibacter toxicus]PPG23076.1 hypothetical protein C5D15_02145 [Rathayibacter toxicus]PPG47658.1 hypothetical protein C5D16_02140 [Rathayibacter toxicus]